MFRDPSSLRDFVVQSWNHEGTKSRSFTKTVRQID